MGKKGGKGKKNPPTQNPSITGGSSRRGSNAGGGSKRGSNASAYGAVPSGTESDTNIRNPSSRRTSSKSVPLERKPSPVEAPLSTLNGDEYEFFSMVSEGDAQGVIKYLTSPDFESRNKNINRFNKNGYTALHMAVRRQDEEMINILLKTPNIQLYDIILHAIREDNLEVTKLLLKINDKLMEQDGIIPNQQNDDEDESYKARQISNDSGISTSLRPIPSRTQTRSRTSVTGLSGSISRISPTGSTVSAAPSVKKDYRDEIPFDSEFHQVITPLMLAAHVGSTQLMELFYKRGERLETNEYNHNMGCSCKICAELHDDEDMTRVHTRYHLFKAICQPEYINLMALKITVDPINYAIDKIVKLRDIMRRDPAYDQMYLDFVEELDNFCTDMLSMCWTTEETEIFLSPKDSQKKLRLPHLNPRLWYTTGLDMKSFVAHPNAQNVLYDMWATDKWPDWETYGTLFRLFNLAIRVVTFPVIAFILLVADGTKLGKSLGSPIGRFLNYVASYIVFLVLVGFQVSFPYQRCNGEEDWFTYTVGDENCMKKGPPNIGTEWLLIIYIAGFAASTLKRHSVSWYWAMKWNWYDLVFILSFLATFTCWLLSWVDGPGEDEPRLNWSQYSPEVLGECFLTMSTMLACGRLLRFLQIFSEIGPLQVILGKQIASFLSTAFMFLIVLCAFASALFGLYVPYKDYEGFDDHHKHKGQDDEFCTITSALPHLFHHLIDPGSAGELVTWENVVNETGQVEVIHHIVNQYTGKLILIAYHVVGFLMMYNMLTGYFGQTMGVILEDSDRIWKFTRTELYITHIKDTMLPPPFNLIPTLRTIGRALKWFTKLGKKGDEKAACSFRQCCYITESEKEGEWRERMDKYRETILRIIVRYAKFRKESQEKEQASRDDVLEIGEEITELKEKLRIEGNLESSGGGGDGKDSDDDDFNNFPRNPPNKKQPLWDKPKLDVRETGKLQGPSGPISASSPVTSQSQRQSQGSPQAGTSTGNTTLNMGLFNSSPTMQMPQQNFAMGNQPPRTKQRSFSPPSLINIPEVNRNESDSLYGSTTVANVAMSPQLPQQHPFFDERQMTNNFYDSSIRYPWENANVGKYPPPIPFYQEKVTANPYEGRLNHSYSWDKSPIHSDNLQDALYPGRNSGNSAGSHSFMETNVRGTSNHAWEDQSQHPEYFSPPYFRGRPKES